MTKSTNSCAPPVRPSLKVRGLAGLVLGFSAHEHSRSNDVITTTAAKEAREASDTILATGVSPWNENRAKDPVPEGRYKVRSCCAAPLGLEFMPESSSTG